MTASTNWPRIGPAAYRATTREDGFRREANAHVDSFRALTAGGGIRRENPLKVDTGSNPIGTTRGNASSGWSPLPGEGADTGPQVTRKRKSTEQSRIGRSSLVPHLSRRRRHHVMARVQIEALRRPVPLPPPGRVMRASRRRSSDGRCFGTPATQYPSAPPETLPSGAHTRTTRPWSLRLTGAASRCSHRQDREHELSRPVETRAPSAPSTALPHLSSTSLRLCAGPKWLRHR